MQISMALDNAASPAHTPIRPHTDLGAARIGLQCDHVEYVVLPAPDGPMIASTCPEQMVAEMPARMHLGWFLATATE